MRYAARLSGAPTMPLIGLPLHLQQRRNKRIELDGVHLKELVPLLSDRSTNVGGMLKSLEIDRCNTTTTSQKDLDNLPKRPVVFPCLCVVALLAGAVLFGSWSVVQPPFEFAFESDVNTDNALCVAAVRSATKVTVSLPMGSVGLELTLLVRLDQLIEPNAQSFVRIWTPRVLESSSIKCVQSVDEGAHGVTSCIDTALFLQQRGNQPIYRRATRLLFDVVQEPEDQFKSYVYDGELRLPLRNRGDVAVVDDTHVCFTWQGEASEPGDSASASSVVPITYRYDNLTNSDRSSPWSATTTIELLKQSAYFRDASNNPLLCCTYNQSVSIFPIAATDDVYWYGVHEEQKERFRVSNQLTELDDEADRGLYCHDASGSYRAGPHNRTRMYYAFLAQCTAYDVCERPPSIPTRRLSTALMRLELVDCADSGGLCTVALDANVSNVLRQQPYGSDDDDSANRALWKVAAVLMMTLAVHVHSDEVNSKGAWIYRQCTKIDYWMQIIQTFELTDPEATTAAEATEAKKPTETLHRTLQRRIGCELKLYKLCKRPLPVSLKNLNDFCNFISRMPFETVQDFALAGLSAVLRVVITQLAKQSLEDDGRSRVYFFAITAASIAVAYWSTRLLLIVFFYCSDDVLIKDHEHEKYSITHEHSTNSLANATDHADRKPSIVPPLALTVMRTLLGGTAAIIDANAAMLITFSVAPVVIYTERFDTIARLLVGSVSAMLTLPRCVWGTSCSALQLTQYCFIERTQGCQRFVWISACSIALLHWVSQGIVLFVTLSDLVATPCAILWSRPVVSSTQELALTILAFLGSFGMSRTLMQASSLMQWKRDGMKSVFEAPQGREGNHPHPHTGDS